MLLRTGVSIFALATLTLSARAQETTTYQYDQLGRLVRSDITGGPNSTVKTATCFDKAGNRSKYFTGKDAAPACAAPAPTSAAAPSSATAVTRSAAAPPLKP